MPYFDAAYGFAIIVPFTAVKGPDNIREMVLPTNSDLPDSFVRAGTPISIIFFDFLLRAGANGIYSNSFSNSSSISFILRLRANIFSSYFLLKASKSNLALDLFLWT